MAVRKPVSWCACCGDAMSARLCSACKADPANKDWHEAPSEWAKPSAELVRRADSAESGPFPEAAEVARDLSESARRVFVAMWETGETKSPSVLSSATGLSKQVVMRAMDEILQWF